jgi:UDPglucose 6-dehydrogenase
VPEARIGVPDGVRLAASPIEACTGADVLAVLTEWDDFKWVDPAEVAKVMTGRHIVDGRNILDRSQWRKVGFDYEGIGR